MILATFILVASAAATDTPNVMPAQLVGPWVVEVGPGTVTVEGRTITLAEKAVLRIPPPKSTQVRDEQHAALPVFNPKGAPWRKGLRFNALITQECSATGLLDPASVRVKAAVRNGKAYIVETDFQLDGLWGTIGRIEGGGIPANTPVFIDYDYTPRRLDSIVIDAAGVVQLRVGTPGKGIMPLPGLAAGQTALVNLWFDGPTEKLTADNLYPVDFTVPEPPKPGASQAERFLPKTLAKLRAGEPVTIIPWGDSVTNGGGVGKREDWYQEQFGVRLRERFPESAITVQTAAWGGASSSSYMAQPRGSKYDFVRDVLEPKADLVTIEFVNDAGLGAKTGPHYAKILRQIQASGAEVVLITPHLVRIDWMGTGTAKFDKDPRPYVIELKKFAAENNLALADASSKWCCLWRKGIPYETLLGNSINHPDVRGHALFADALMELFPAK